MILFWYFFQPKLYRLFLVISESSLALVVLNVTSPLIATLPLAQLIARFSFGIGMPDVRQLLGTGIIQLLVQRLQDTIVQLRLSSSQLNLDSSSALPKVQELLNEKWVLLNHLVWILDGAVLVHTTFGDLLRTLEAPNGFYAPENVTMSREGIVVVGYEKGNIAAFTMNGRRLRYHTHHDTIQVFHSTDE